MDKLYVSEREVSSSFELLRREGVKRLSPQSVRKYALKLPLGFCMTSEIFFWFHLNRK